MSIFRRIMLSGGLNIDIDLLPETQKIYYTATGKVTPKSGTIGTVIANSYNSNTGEGVMCFNSDVIKIGATAFESNKFLTSVTIPDSVTSIGSGAFEYCTSLTSVTIPDSVTSIGDFAFQFCDSLSSVYITDIAAWYNISFGTSYSNPLLCAGNLYLNNELVTDLIIPDSVTSIGERAFEGCSSLTSITIPDSVKSIGSYTFRYCSSLTNITIPESVTSIGWYAFRGCSSLTSITIGNSVTSIGEGAFYDCSRLKSVYCKATTPPALEWTSVFDYNGSARLIYVPVESVEMYKDATNWSEYASAMVAYDFENGTIASDYKLEYTSNDNKVVSLYSTSGFNAKVLANVYENGKGVICFNNPITSIGSRAFVDCKSLTSITIPNSVTSIGDAAFTGCRSLTSVYYNGDLSDWCNIDFYSSGSNPLSNYAKLYINNTEVTEVTIPSDISEIKDYAFYGYSSLISITIPEGVTTIGRDTFHDCDNLTSITIPNSVTCVGDSAFKDCKSLTSVTIGNGVTSIGYGAFNECSRLTSVYCKATTPPSLGSNAFNYWNGSDYVPYGCDIYVPVGSVEAYKSAEYWGDYSSEIVGYNFN